MSLTIVSTPIGDYGDMTLRAIETLKTVDGIICEEIKPARVLLKRIGASPDKDLFQLNEHSKSQELPELVDLCRTKNMALISDCGTPGFCDPGSDLIDACYKAHIPVQVNPGVSSLMTLISLSGEKLREFHFVGFLPAEKTERAQRIANLRGFKSPLIVMDTPYRLSSTVKELGEIFGNHKAILGIDLTGEKHQVEKGKLGELAKKDWPKSPFVLMVLPG